MPQASIFTIKGLYTFSNDTLVPQGSLTICKNIDLSKPGIATPRRGFDNYSAQANTNDINYSLFTYASTLFSHVNGTALYGYISNVWTSKGSITKPTYAKALRTAFISKNLYLTSDSGLKKLDSVSNNIYNAGIPKGLHIALSLSGAGTAVPNNEYVAYRYLIARKDAQNNTIFGGVSGKAVIQNTSGSAQDISVTSYIPSGLTAGEHYLQLYRTVGSTGTPNDNMKLCYEQPLTSTHISNGYVTITDIVIDDLLGADLYTSPSQQGISNDNAMPPLASDICEFNNYLFYADVVNRHKILATLISCGGSNGLVVNDTFTIVSGATTETYTAKATASVGSKEFAVDTTSSVSVRIDNTIRSLVDVINRGSALVYAYLLSTGDLDLPGKIVIESRALGSSSFTIASSRATPWSPQLSSSPGVTQTSTNDEYKNGIMFSKAGQPEAVPTKNLLFVGSSDDRIRRIIALKDSLIILKEKDGAYTLKGQNESSFTVSLLDSSAKIVAPESAVVVNNLIYCLAETGIISISDNGVSILSQNIKDKVNNQFSTDLLTPTKDYAFGISYEVEGKYYLCLPSVNSDTSSTYQLTFNIFNESFEESDLNIKCGFVNPIDNKLYLGSGNSKYVKYERKTYAYEDYADFEGTRTITAQSGRVLSIDGTDNMTVGDIILQGTLEPSYITSIDLPAGTITVDNDQIFVLNTADVTHLKAINCEIEWAREFAGNPAGLKHHAEAIFTFKDEFIGTGTFGFSSDINPSVSNVEIEGPAAADGWGLQAWGEGLWGGDGNPNPVRVGIPYAVARGNALTVNFQNYKAYSGFELTGISLVFNPISTRVSR